MIEKYNLKYFFNAKHYVVIDGNKSMTHPHNWQIEIEVRLTKKEMLNYRVIDKKIEEILSSLDGKVLNDEKEFEKIKATTENLGRVFCEKISEKLSEMDCVLEKLKISENASRTFTLERE